MKNTEATRTNKSSKQQQDEMYARLAAKEATIEANHQRYLGIMRAANAAQGIVVDREQGFIFDPETGRLVFVS